MRAYTTRSARNRSINTQLANMSFDEKIDLKAEVVSFILFFVIKHRTLVRGHSRAARRAPPVATAKKLQWGPGRVEQVKKKKKGST